MNTLFRIVTHRAVEVKLNFNHRGLLYDSNDSPFIASFQKSTVLLWPFVPQVLCCVGNEFVRILKDTDVKKLGFVLCQSFQWEYKRGKVSMTAADLPL